MKQDEVRDGRRPGHFWIDNEVLDDHGPTLGANAMAVYMVLARHSNNGVCFPATATIAQELKLSRPTVIKSLQALKDAGLILIEERTIPVRGQTSNLYTLLQVHKTGVKEIDTGMPTGVKDVDRPCKGDLHPPVKHVDTNNTKKNKTKGISGDVAARLEAMTFDDGQIKTIAAAAAKTRGEFTLDDVETCERWLDSQRTGWDGKYGTLYNRLKVGKLPVIPRTNGHQSVPPQPTLTMADVKRQEAEMRVMDPEYARIKEEIARNGW